MIDRILDSGWRYLRFHAQCFVQLPPNFHGDTIPDEYIFQPDWNKEIVNAWWASHLEER